MSIVAAEHIAHPTAGITPDDYCFMPLPTASRSDLHGLTGAGEGARVQDQRWSLPSWPTARH